MPYSSPNFNLIIRTLNYLSLFCAVTALLLFIICCVLKPALANRVSLRLQAGISACDVLIHLLLIHYNISIRGPVCAAIGVSHVVLRQWYCFLNIAIGVNLQLIFIHELNPKPRWEVMYWVIPVFVSLTMNIPPLALDEFGEDTEGKHCFFKEKTRTNVFVILNVATTLFVAFAYCTTISILVILRIRGDWASVAATTFNQVDPSGTRLKVLERKMKHLVFRIALYPSVTFITLSGYTVHYAFFLATGNMPDIVWAWSAVGQVLSGLFNLVAFCFDPSFHYCMVSIWADIRRRLFKSPPMISANPLEDIRNSNVPSPQLSEPSLNLDLVPTSYPDPYVSGDDDEYCFTLYDDAECRAAMNSF